jgi:hypothetical protein
MDSSTSSQTTNSFEIEAKATVKPESIFNHIKSSNPFLN